MLETEKKKLRLFVEILGVKLKDKKEFYFPLTSLLKNEYILLGRN